MARQVILDSVKMTINILSTKMNFFNTLLLTVFKTLALNPNALAGLSNIGTVQGRTLIAVPGWLFPQHSHSLSPGAFVHEELFSVYIGPLTLPH